MSVNSRKYNEKYNKRHVFTTKMQNFPEIEAPRISQFNKSPETTGLFLCSVAKYTLNPRLFYILRIFILR